MKNKSSIFLWCDRRTDSAQQRNCKRPASQTDAPKSRVLSYTCAYTSQLGIFELTECLSLLWSGIVRITIMIPLALLPPR